MGAVVMMISVRYPLRRAHRGLEAQRWLTWVEHA
jgi:hypothetical protein